MYRFFFPENIDTLNLKCVYTDIGNSIQGRLPWYSFLKFTQTTGSWILFCCKMENTMESKMLTLLQVICSSFPVLDPNLSGDPLAFGGQIHVFSVYQVGTWTF